MIANGRLYNDKDGNFTFCSERGLNITDYLLVNLFDFDSLQTFEILDWNNFSDHAALYFSFMTKCGTNTYDNIESQTKLESKLFLMKTELTSLKRCWQIIYST